MLKFFQNCKWIFLMRSGVWLRALFSADGRKCFFIYLFISQFDCWDFFSAEHSCLGPTMQKGPIWPRLKIVVRGPREIKRKENRPAESSRRWLPAGIIWGVQRLLFLLPHSLFPAWWAGWKAQTGHGCWHKHSGRALTALLTWHLLLSHQAKRGGRKEGKRGKDRRTGYVWMQKRLELNCNFGAAADLRAAGEAEKHDLLHPSARAASSLREKNSVITFTFMSGFVDSIAL